MSNLKNEFNRRIYNYALSIIKFSKILPKDEVFQVLTKQLIRSGTSVAANIIEAQSASSRKDYINFYTNALKSANESKFWINLIKDSNKINNPKSDELLKETDEIAKILGKSIITMKIKSKI